MPSQMEMSFVYSKKDSSANNVVVEYNTVMVPKGESIT